jgi:hypothetical protein
VRPYQQVVELVRQTIEPAESSLAALNVRGLQSVCDYLDIPFRYNYLSELDLALGEISEPDDWGLQVSLALGADTYINPPGGASFYDPAKYAAAGVDLVIQESRPLTYQCRGYSFIPYLSVIDVCMWNSPAEIRRFLDGYSAQTQPVTRSAVPILLSWPELSLDLLPNLVEQASACLAFA